MDFSRIMDKNQEPPSNFMECNYPLKSLLSHTSHSRPPAFTLPPCKCSSHEHHPDCLISALSYLQRETISLSKVKVEEENDPPSPTLHLSDSLIIPHTIILSSSSIHPSPPSSPTSDDLSIGPDDFSPLSSPSGSPPSPPFLPSLYQSLPTRCPSSKPIPLSTSLGSSFSISYSTPPSSKSSRSSTRSSAGISASCIPSNCSVTFPCSSSSSCSSFYPSTAPSSSSSLSASSSSFFAPAPSSSAYIPPLPSAPSSAPSLSSSLPLPSHSPPTSPPSSDASLSISQSLCLSPRANSNASRVVALRSNYTGAFQLSFHKLVRDHNASAAWHAFRRACGCSVARAPCANGLVRFCTAMGGDFAELCKTQNFARQGSRTKCVCVKKIKFM